MYLLLLISSGYVASSHSMEQEDVLELELQKFPRELRETILKMFFESTFGTNFEPLKEIITGKTLVSAAVSPDRETVVLASSDGKASVWDIKKGEFLKELVGHTGNVLCVAFSYDGKFILTGSADKTARVWDIKSGIQLQRFLTRAEVLTVAWSPNGKAILAGLGNGMIQLWESDTGKVLYENIKPGVLYERDLPSVVTFSPNGKWMAIGFHNRTTDCRESETGKLRYSFVSMGSVYALSFSPDSKSLSIGASFKGMGGGPVKGVVHVGDIESGKELGELKNPFGRVLATSFSSEGEFLFTGVSNGIVAVWNMATGKMLRVIKVKPKTGVLKVALSSDEETLITVSKDGTIIQWGVSWDPAQWFKGLTPSAREAALLVFVTKLYQLLAGGKNTELKEESL